MSYKRGKQLQIEDLNNMYGNLIILVDKKTNEDIVIKRLIDSNSRNFIIYETNNKDIEMYEYIKIEKEIEEVKQYEYWEIMKLIHEKELTKNDIIIDMNGGTCYVNAMLNNAYGVKFLADNIFTIKEREELKTFDEIRKLGTPYHKTLGYNYGNIDSAYEFVKEINKKVWKLDEK